jgi:hypothetical protein
MTLSTKLSIVILSLLSLQAFTTPSCVVKSTKDIMRSVSGSVFNVAFEFDAASAGDTMSPIAIPQNLNGWVGPEQYILMSYGVIRSFNKFTGARDNILNVPAENFFGTDSNDVRIVYNRFAQRWIFSCNVLDADDVVPRDIVLVVSGDSVITETTSWNVYTIPYSDINPNYPAGALDYTQLSSDANAIYLVSNAFNDIDFTTYVGSSAVVVGLDSAVNGGPLVYQVFPELLPNGLNTQYIPPADNYNAEPPTGSNQVVFYRIENPGTPAAVISDPLFVTVPPFGYAEAAPHLGNLYGIDGDLQTGNALMWAPHVRGNNLFAAHDIQVDQNGDGSDAGDRVGVRWYQFDVTGGGVETLNTLPTLVQYGTIFDGAAVNPKFYFNASIMTNKNLDLVISSSVSGENDYTDVIYAARKATSATGALTDPVYITHNGTDTQYSYNFGPLAEFNAGAILGQRWGDESSLSPDPINDLEIWNTQELATSNNAWCINVSKLVPA